MTIDIPKEFSVEAVADFRIKINSLIESGTVSFIFDFSNCTFIDSTGLGALVSIYKRCLENSGDISLKSLNHDVEKLFKLTRLDRIFTIE